MRKPHILRNLSITFGEDDTERWLESIWQNSLMQLLHQKKAKVKTRSKQIINLEGFLYINWQFVKQETGTIDLEVKAYLEKL